VQLGRSATECDAREGALFTVYHSPNNTTILIHSHHTDSDGPGLDAQVASDGAHTLVIHGQPDTRALSATQPSAARHFRRRLAV
jgi:hypothetical protein